MPTPRNPQSQAGTSPRHGQTQAVPSPERDGPIESLEALGDLSGIIKPRETNPIAYLAAAPVVDTLQEAPGCPTDDELFDPDHPPKRGPGRPKGSLKRRGPMSPYMITDNKYKASSRTVAEWLALRAIHPNLSNKELAQAIGITQNALYKALQKARRDGALNLAEPLDQLKYQIIPKAVDNLEKLLDSGDRQATLETMKGTLFKVYQAAEGAGENPNMILGIKIEMPDNYDPNREYTGIVVGKPRVLDGESS